MIGQLAFLFVVVMGLASARADVEIDAVGNAIYYGDQGEPRLFVSMADPKTGYVLNWNQDASYSRTFSVTRVSLRTSLGLDEKQASWDQVIRSPSRWLSKILPQKAVELQDLSSLIGFEVSSRSKSALQQILVGASRPHAYANAQDFLAENPMSLSDFTIDVNRQITKAYGMSFALSVYRSLIFANTRNQETYNDILKIFKQKQSVKSLQVLKQKDLKIVIVKGYVQNTDLDRAQDPESLNALINEIRGLGIAFEVVQTHTGDAIEGNAQIISDHLEKNLSQGDQLVVVAVSKGGAELLGGLAQLNRRGALSSKYKGQILGVLLGSALTGESMLAEWSAKFPQYFYTRYKLWKNARAAGQKVTDFRAGLLSLSRSYMRTYIAKISADIPQQLRYINFIGVSQSPQGYAFNEETKALQVKIMNRKSFGLHGANDGFAEYPHLGLSANMTPGSETLALNSDHSIVPGYFANYSLKEPRNRAIFMASLIEYAQTSRENKVLCKSAL